METAQEQQFIPGRVLCRDFFADAVKPILTSRFPDLLYSAALIGPGSEVLGFDDRQSTDHHWGPRVSLFLAECDIAGLQQPIHNALAIELPFEFHGYSTHFCEPDPNDNGTQILEPATSRPIRHRIDVLTLREFMDGYLGIDVDRELQPKDWLSLPQQKLRTIVDASIYHDDLAEGGLAALVARFDNYPDEVWRYQLAAGWARLGQEEHLMGRAGQVGDEIGSAIIGSRLVRDIMRLCFLMERVYAPYPKWFGSAFRCLACASDLEPTLARALHAWNWQTRQKALVPAYEQLARMHNSLGLTRSMPEKAKRFFGRPFSVLAIHGFADELLNTIDSRWLGNTARRSPIGGIDLISDNTDFAEDSGLRGLVSKFYHA